jgi:predicted dehydrogenase
LHSIGFIGAGDVVRKSYLPVLARRDDCKVTAICSHAGQSARELAHLFRIQTVCQNYADLLDRAEVETVFICTPTHLHREMAEAAMLRGKHVLVEKPLCSNYPDSHALLDQAVQYPKTFYAAFNNHFREENRWLSGKILAGELGKTELIDFEWYRTKRYESKTWLYDAKQSGGGVLIDLGAHLIHLALSLLPQRRDFSAYCHNTCYNPMQTSVEDASIAMITIDATTTALIKLGWDMALPTPSQVRLQVQGTKGGISNLAYTGTKADGYAFMIEDFLDHIEKGTKQDLLLVRDTMLLLDALYESSRSGTTVVRKFAHAA